jgi:molybdopterin-guanine dinucleotide biosynthesis protein A
MALEHSRSPNLVITTVDMPGIEVAQLNWLAAQLRLNLTAKGILISRVEGDESSLEPFPCILRREALAIVSREFQAGQRSVRQLADGKEIVTVAAPPGWPDHLWINLNTPKDLAQFVARSS